MPEYSYYFSYKFLHAGLLSDSERILLIDITRSRDAFRAFVRSAFDRCVEDRAPFAELIDELSAYLDGKLTRFSPDFRLALPQNVSHPFDHVVLKQTARIPFGKMKSYGEVARLIGKPAASRAVGSALGRNKFPIIIPCHRVIRGDRGIGGYGGGTALKEKLLSLEGVKVRGGKVEP